MNSGEVNTYTGRDKWFGPFLWYEKNLGESTRSAKGIFDRFATFLFLKMEGISTSLIAQYSILRRNVFIIR